MKVIHLSSGYYDVDIVIDNIAYLLASNEGETPSYTLIMVDGKSFPLSAEEFEEIKSYLMQ